MSHFRRYFISFAFLLTATPCLGLSGVPSLSYSTAFTAYTGPGVPSLMVLPDGTGNPFTEARDPAGNTVDVTITLNLMDGAPSPIVNFPHEDLWLESSDGGLVPCLGGTCADENTDGNGMTWWTAPLRAGGYSQSPILVMVNGSALVSNSGLLLNTNSPDINGDLAVQLSDVGFFAGDFYSVYNFRSDFNGDGILNLSDVGILAEGFGARCP